MSEPMVCIMRSWLRARDRRAGDDPYLFPSQQGGPLERHSINHSLHRYARRVGVATPLGPHAFRRSFATASLRDGASMVSVQQTLGHATLHMTRRYAAMIDTDGYQAVTAHSPLVTMARKVTATAMSAASSRLTWPSPQPSPLALRGLPTQSANEAPSGRVTT